MQQHKDRDPLGWMAMAAAIVIAAHGEWSLAVAVGFAPQVAAALPVAIDAYAIRAMRAGREVLPAVLLMVATNAAAHLHHSGLLETSPALVVAVSAIAPVVLWRVHALRHHARQETPPAPPTVPPAAAGDAPEAAPVPRVSLTREPAPTPAALPAATSLVICGAHLGVPAVPPRPKLSAEEARDVIEQAWREGLSVREAARRSTRSPSQVQRVYARLGEASPMAA